MIANAIAKHNWVFPGFLVAFSLSVFAGLNGIKAGWAGAIASASGILLQTALSVTWMYWALGAILLGCIILAIASILRKNMALENIVGSMQHYKEGQGLEASKKISKSLKYFQRPFVRKMVIDAKAKLKKYEINDLGKINGASE